MHEMQETLYTTAEVAKITGFSVRQLDYWARKNMVLPSYHQAHGSGSRRLYTIDDLVQLNIIRRLKQYNWSTQKIHKAINILKDVMNDSDPLRNALLIHGKGTIFALSKTREGERILIDALSTTGQQVMSFVLETIHDEVRNAAPTLTVGASICKEDASVTEAHRGRELCR